MRQTDEGDILSRSVAVWPRLFATVGGIDDNALMLPRLSPTHLPIAASSARLFLAAWPDETTTKQIAAYCRQCRWPHRAAPVSPSRHHLTLHFIGTVDRARLPEIAAGLGVALQPCQLLFDQPALWPNDIAVLQASVLPPPLSALHDQLADALRRLALPVEKRRFRPHLTLARHANGAMLPVLAAPVCWPIDGYALVESVLGRSGGYCIVQRYA